MDYFRRWFGRRASQGAGGGDYTAFISYKHNQQAELVTRFVAALKSYAKPAFARPIKVFRDENHLTPGIDLPELIRKSLVRSDYLVLLATPGAAQSAWVHDELKIWCGELGRTERLIIVVLDGELQVDAQAKTIDWQRTDCLPPVLKEFLTAVPYYLDLRAIPPDRATLADPAFKQAVNAIVSRFRDIDPNELLGEEIAQYRRGKRIRRAVVAGIVLLALGFALTTLLAEGQRKRALSALLESSGREAVIASRDDRPAAGLAKLRAAIKAADSPFGLLDVALPATALDAGFLSLIEDRTGPALSFPLSERSLARIEAAENTPPTAAFSDDRRLVAAATSFEGAIWRSADGAMVRAIRSPHEIETVVFNKGATLLLIVAGSEERRVVTAIDVKSGKSATRSVERCAGFPCLRTASKRGAWQHLSGLVDLDEMTGAAGSDMNTTYIVPTAYYRGAAAGRYHVFAPETEADAGRITVVDATAQRAGKVDLGGHEVAVASGKPVLAVGGMTNIDGDGEFLRLFALASENGQLSLSRLQEIYLPGVTRTADLWLDPMADTLFFNSHSVGTGGGLGLRMAGAIDVQSRRLLWGKPFEGAAIYHEGIKVRAQTDGAGTLVNAKDGERLFGFDGVPLAFSRDGGKLLSQTENTQTAAGGWVANLRLIEVVKKKRMSSYELTPRSSRGECSLSRLPFRQFDTELGRHWNQHDWARVARPASLGKQENRGAVSEASWRRYSFESKQGAIRVTSLSQDGEHALSHPEQARLAAHYRALTGKDGIPEHSILGVARSRDGRWSGELVMTPSLDDKDDSVKGRWWIFDESSKRRVLATGSISGEWINSGNNTWQTLQIYFPQGMELGFVQTAPCELAAISLSSGRQLGSPPLAFTNIVAIEPVSSDVAMIYSQDWYGATRVVQLISAPDFRPGPSLIFDDESVRDDALDPISFLPSRPAGDASRREAGGDTEEVPEEPEECPSSPFVVDGRVLVFVDDRTKACKPGPDAKLAVRLPPWGKRLEAILRAK